MVDCALVTVNPIDDAFSNGLRPTPPHFNESLLLYLTGAHDSGFMEAFSSYFGAHSVAQSLHRRHSVSIVLRSLNFSIF